MDFDERTGRPRLPSLEEDLHERGLHRDYGPPPRMNPLGKRPSHTYTSSTAFGRPSMVNFMHIPEESGYSASEGEEDSEEEEVNPGETILRRREEFVSITANDRRDIVDETASYLLTVLKSKEKSSAATAQALFNVLAEKTKHERLLASFKRTRSNTLETMFESSLEAQQRGHRSSIVDEELGFSTRERLLAMVKRSREDFAGYFFDDVDFSDLSGTTFVQACIHGDKDVVFEVLDALDPQGSQKLVRWEDHLGQTVLHRLAALDIDRHLPEHVEIVERVLEAGANPNHFDTLGWTPIFYAVQNGHRHLVGCLCEGGADLQLRDHPRTAGSTNLRERRGSVTHEDFLKPELVYLGRTVFLKERSVFEWCSVSQNRKTLEYLQKFTFIKFEHPSRRVQGVVPIYHPSSFHPNSVNVVWTSHVKKPVFRLTLHIVGTLSSFTRELQNENLPCSFTDVCEYATLKILDGAQPIPRENAEAGNLTTLIRQYSSTFSVSEPLKSNIESIRAELGWGKDSFIGLSSNFEKLFSLPLAESVEGTSYTWHPPPSLKSRVPEDALVVFEVNHVRNASIRGLSEVFPLFVNNST